MPLRCEGYCKCKHTEVLVLILGYSIWIPHISPAVKDLWNISHRKRHRICTEFYVLPHNIPAAAYPKSQTTCGVPVWLVATTNIMTLPSNSTGIVSGIMSCAGTFIACSRFSVFFELFLMRKTWNPSIMPFTRCLNRNFSQSFSHPCVCIFFLTGRLYSGLNWLSSLFHNILLFLIVFWHNVWCIILMEIKN